mgnify:CR=1 FL=1
MRQNNHGFPLNKGLLIIYYLFYLQCLCWDELAEPTYPEIRNPRNRKSAKRPAAVSADRILKLSGDTYTRDARIAEHSRYVV